MKVGGFFIEKTVMGILGGMIAWGFFLEPSFGQSQEQSCSFHIEEVLSEISGGIGGVKATLSLAPFIGEEGVTLYIYDRYTGREIAVVRGRRRGGEVSFILFREYFNPRNSIGILKYNRYGVGVGAYVGLFSERGRTVELVNSDFTEELASVRIAPETVGILYELGGQGLTAEIPRVVGLMERLRDPDRTMRRRAVFDVERLGRLVFPLVPRLTEMALQDSDSIVREDAAATLQRLGNRAAGAVDRLVEVALRHPDLTIRVKATDILEGLGALLSSAVDQLKSALQDQDAGVRESAAYALGKLGPLASSTASDLALALRDSDTEVRRNAANALVSIGGMALPILEQLLTTAEDASFRGVLHDVIERIRAQKPSIDKSIFIETFDCEKRFGDPRCKDRE